MMMEATGNCSRDSKEAAFYHCVAYIAQEEGDEV
jgi:hypothetical protein